MVGDILKNYTSWDYVLAVFQLLAIGIVSYLLQDYNVLLGGGLLIAFNLYYRWQPLWLLLPVLFSIITYLNVSSINGVATWQEKVSVYLGIWDGIHGAVIGFSLAAVFSYTENLKKLPFGNSSKTTNPGKRSKRLMINKLPTLRTKNATKSKGAKKLQITPKHNRATKSLNYKAIHLGKELVSGEPVALQFKDLAQHGAVFGSTGTGKTTSIMNFIQYAVKYNIALVYVDGKGDPDLLKNMESICPYLMSFSMASNRGGYNYNPFALGTATELKDKIVDALYWSEQYYKTTAERYLQLALKALMAEQGSNKLDLNVLAYSLAIPQAITAARHNFKNQQEKEKVIEALQSIKEKDIGSLLNQVNGLAESDVGTSLSEKKGKTISFSKVIEEGKMCLISLDSLSYPQLARALGRLVVSDIKTTLAYNQKNNMSKPVIIVLDEFGVFIGENVLNIINMGRSAGANVILAAQGLADLETEGSVLGKQILNNCNTYLIHRINSPAESELIAGMIGTKDGVQITRQVKGKEGSVREVKEFIVHPDKIKGMKQGEAILLARASKQQLKIIKVKRVRT